MKLAVFQIKNFRSLLQQRDLFFQVTTSLELSFGSLQCYSLKKQSQIQTNKIVFQQEKLFCLVRTLRLLLPEYTGVVNNPSSTKLSYSKLKNAVLNPSKAFLALKKVSARILSTFERSFSKKSGKTPSSHIIHSLGGEYC